jgi:hypothetical protein
MPLCFQPLRGSLYSVDELFAGFVASCLQSYTESADFQIYLQYLAAGSYAPTDYTMAMLEAAHDNATRQATQSYLWRWCVERLPLRRDGYTLDLDSTRLLHVDGHQEGVQTGYTRLGFKPSLHLLLAVLAEARLVVEL